MEDDEVQKEIANHLVLASNLQSRSWRIASLNSTQMDDDIANALVISLVELDRPILFDLREETFNILKRMVNVASTILWVFGDTVTSDQGPKFHLIEGFARSIRTENPGLKFITLSLALHTPRTSIQYCSKSIVKVLSRTLNFNITEVEDEFYQRQGRLLIPRLVQDVELDEEVTNRVESERRNLRAFGSGGPLKLNVGVPGLLDSLHFVRDDQPSLPIGPDEVEVEVKVLKMHCPFSQQCTNLLGDWSELHGLPGSSRANKSFDPRRRVRGYRQASWSQCFQQAQARSPRCRVCARYFQEFGTMLFNASDTDLR